MPETESRKAGDCVRMSVTTGMPKAPVVVGVRDRLSDSEWTTRF
jgi:hypothetical protein